MKSRILTALAVILGVVSCAVARTVDIVAQTAKTVTLEFGQNDGHSYSLFLAHGAVDQQEQKHAWTGFAACGLVAADETTRVVEVPASLRDGRYLRFFLMQTDGCAFAQELKCVRSTGAQRVDIGFFPNSGNLSCDFRFGDVTYVASTAFFGQNWTGNRYLFNQQSGVFYFHSSGTNTGVSPTASTDFRLQLNQGNIMELQYGTTVKRWSVSRSLDATQRMSVFGCNTGNNLATFRFDRLRFSNFHELMRDFIPAKNSAGVAGLYDQVQDKFYVSVTSTALVAGDPWNDGRDGRVMDETLTFRFRRALSVSSATADAVTLAFDNPDGATYDLCVASGTTDQKTAKNAWANFTTITTLTAKQTSYTYTLPDELKQSGTFYRFFLVKTTDLPYTAEVASLTSTGAQTIDSGFIPSTRSTFDMTLGNITYVNGRAFFGQGWQGCAFLFNQQSNGFTFHGRDGIVSGAYPTANTTFRARNTELGEFIIDSPTARTVCSEPNAPQPFGRSVTIFNVPYQSNGTAFRFDTLKFLDAGYVARDFIPVIANGKGALFDRVMGELHTNQQTTDFTKGATLARTGWVVDTSATFAAGSTTAIDETWWKPVADTVSVDGDTVTLTADSDWSEIIPNIPATAKVTLAGHTLKMTPAATVTTCEPFEIVGASGTLEITVPEGQSFWGTPLVRTGVASSIVLVKKGTGTFVANNVLTGVSSIDVAAGTWCCGRTSMITAGIPVNVQDGATFDFAGKGGNCGLFTIAGSGVDGKGVLYNTTAGALGAGVGQMAGITLAADATVGSVSHIGLINNSYNATKLELDGHTLTVSIASGCGFWLANTTGSSEGTIIVKQGVFYPYKNNTTTSLPNVDVILDGANSIYRCNTDGAQQYFRDVTLLNGASFEEIDNRAHLRNLYVNEGCTVPNKAVKWIYLTQTLTVSNETGTIEIYPPITTYNGNPQLVKYGAGTVTIKNNHTDQQMYGGVDVKEGTVIMSATRGNDYAHLAICSSYAPYTVRKGATLDMTQCTNPPLVSMLTVEDGATLKYNAGQTIAVKNTFTTLEPFYFAGTVRADNPTFALADLFEGANAPKPGDSITLFRAGKLATYSQFTVTGCPYDYEILVSDTTATLHLFGTDETKPAAIKICTMGGTYAYQMTADGTANCSFRGDLAQSLANEGWNIQMTGWRSDLRFSNGSNSGNAAWVGHSGATDHALKTSAKHAGILEGLEDFCSAANEPDFTIFICGDTDLKDGVADATVFAHWTNAISRIKSALPMTTVIAATLPEGTNGFNTLVKDWCENESDVSCVDFASLVTAGAVTKAQLAAAAAAFKAQICALATKDGKKAPSTWVRPTVTLGATNNVPAAYLSGYTLARVIELPQQLCDLRQAVHAIPYSYEPVIQETGISKVGYYIELVHKTTGELKALWVDMDAPDSTLTKLTLPVSGAQYMQQAVTKLHVWSNTRAVTQVPADDDTVTGYIEFNNTNYAATERNPTGGIADPYTGIFGFDDTMTIGTGSGHGCFQLMRKFADTTCVPAGEVLYSLTSWGNTAAAGGNGCGIGTLANYGNLGWTADLDRTFAYGTGEVANLCSFAYSTSRISIYVQYAETPAVVDRATAADANWCGTTDMTFWQATNWVTQAGANPTSFDYCVWRLPEGKTADFEYNHVDSVTHWATTFLVDGTANFPQVGGFYINTIDVGPNGVLCFDPTEFSWRLRAAPTFQAGGKFRLPAKYANNTKGRFLLFTIDRIGDATEADYVDAFDTTSAQGLNPKITIEKRANGQSYIWLDLAYGEARKTLNVLCVGDSITQGSNSTYGNWRTLLAKKIEAAGYTANMKGYWTIQSADINQQTLPEAWCRHAGISGQRIISGGGAGTVDAIEATLDQAGDCDFILVKLGTNDINGSLTPVATLFPMWKTLFTKILDQKPHAKVVAGAVVDIAYNADRNALVTSFNAAVKEAIEGGTFPAGRTFFSDLYTPCYRYDADGNYISGSFYSSTDLHPDWPGEVKMAETYLATMTNAIANAEEGWDIGTHETMTETTTGMANNVPAADREGFKLARVFDVVGNNGVNLATLGEVPYSETEFDATAAVTNIARVGYYIELTRKDGAGSTYDGLTRWMWVTVDAFGNRTIEVVGVPLTQIYQGAASRLRVKTNMPGIANTSEGSYDTGWIEFWPSSYTNPSSGIVGAPLNTWTYDWNDTRSDNMSGFGSMQIHRLTPGKTNPAQTLFAFNRWTVAGGYDIGLGNFANQTTGSMDWTFTGESGKNMFTTMAPNAYSVARIEIWTLAGDETATTGAWLDVEGFSTEGDVTTVVGTVGDFTQFGTDATSATVTLEWSQDPTFATVTGSQDLGTVTQAGKITGTITGLGEGTWYYRFRATTSAGTSDTSVTSAGDTHTVATWRPQSASDTWQSDAWLVTGAGTPVAFTANWGALFDGEETAQPAAITLDADVDAAGVTFNAATDYTLTGAGALKTAKFVKKGAGTLTLEKAVLSRTSDITVEEGVVKLGDAAVKGAAGMDGGTITVKNGGQFDLNFVASSYGADACVRPTITSKKKFVIAGAGPDGTGALVSTGANSNWSNPIDEVVLTGDATIGGTGRLDMRGNPKNSITGPTNAVLTIANNSVSTIGINVHGPIQVGRVDITKGSMLTLENTTTEVDAPLGLNLYGSLNMYACTPKWHNTLVRAKGDSAAIGANGGTSYFNGALEVESGAALTLNLAANQFYTGSITNNGTMTVKAGTHWFAPSNFVNGADASVVQAGGCSVFLDGNYPGKMTLGYTGGTLWWGHENYAGMPHPDVLDTSSIKQGTIYFGAKTDATIDAGFTGATPAGVHIRSQSTNTVVTLEPGTYTTTGELVAGDTGRPGFLRLTDGVNVTCGGLFLGNNGGNCKQGRVEIGPGSTLTANSQVWVSHWQDTGVEEHLVICGGTLNANGEGIRVGIDGWHARVDHQSGTVNAGGLICRRGYKNPFSWTDLYQMDSGTLNLGAKGITGYTRYAPFLELNNGAFNASASYTVEQLRSVSFGNVEGGAVDFNIAGNTVNWQTGLRGKADVTLRGTGTFKSGLNTSRTKMRIQGVPTGHWTIANTGANNLYGAAGFAGGLTLEENVAANIKIAGSNLIECAFLQNCSFADAQRISALPFAVNDMSLLNTTGDANDYSSSAIVWQGEFYCDTPGTWTFGGTYDDNAYMAIDGKQVFSSANWQSAAGGTRDLTLGWHEFRIVQYQGGGGWGAGAANATTTAFKNKGFNVGFAKSSVTSTDASVLTKFDGANLPIRPSRFSQGSNGYAHWYSATCSNINNFNTQTGLADNGRFLLSDLHQYDVVASPTFSKSVHEFDGYVYVTAEQAGYWSTYLSWDDRITLQIDGKDAGQSWSSASTGTGHGYVSEGWHTFRIRVADGGGAWGPWSGQGIYARITVNGRHYLFDERYFRIQSDAVKPLLEGVEHAGLDKTVEIKKGATLTNDASDACPIWGVLKGSGALVGKFAFVGRNTCYVVSGTGRKSAVENRIDFQLTNSDGLKELCAVQATFDQKPGRAKYDIGAACGVDVTKLALSVMDKDGNDYTEDFTAVVENDRLVLKNAHPSGMVIFVR